MTKKHYVLIADALHRVRPVMIRPTDKSDERYQWEHDVVAIADALEKDNPKFDCVRFYTACGLRA